MLHRQMLRNNKYIAIGFVLILSYHVRSQDMKSFSFAIRNAEKKADRNINLLGFRYMLASQLTDRHFRFVDDDTLTAKATSLYPGKGVDKNLLYRTQVLKSCKVDFVVVLSEEGQITLQNVANNRKSNITFPPLSVNTISSSLVNVSERIVTEVSQKLMTPEDYTVYTQFDFLRANNRALNDTLAKGLTKTFASKNIITNFSTSTSVKKSDKTWLLYGDVKQNVLPNSAGTFLNVQPYVTAPGVSSKIPLNSFTLPEGDLSKLNWIENASARITLDMQSLFSLNTDQLKMLAKSFDTTEHEALAFAVYLHKQLKNEIVAKLLLDSLDSKYPKSDSIFQVKGNIDEANGDNLNAITNYKKSIELNPKNIYSIAGLAAVYYASGHAPEAFEVVSSNNTTVSASNDASGLLAVATSCLKLVQSDFAQKERCLEWIESYCLKALQIDSKNYRAYQLLAEMRLKRKNRSANDTAMAISYYKKSIALRPDAKEPRTKLSNLYFAIGRKISNPIPYYDSALIFNDKDPDLYSAKAYELYLLYSKADKDKSKLSDAVQCYLNAINLDSANVQNLFDLGYLYQLQKQSDLAIKYYNKALAIDKRNAEALNNIGIVYKQAGNYTEAMKAYSDAIAIDPLYKYPVFNKAALFEAQNQYKDAVEYYSKALALDSGYLECYLRRGKSYYFLVDHKKAWQDFKVYLLKKKSPDIQVYFYGGISAFFNNEYTVAIKYLTQYNEKFPADPWCLYFRGFAYFSTNDYTKAIADYQSAIKNNAKESTFYLRLASAYNANKEIDKAIDTSLQGIKVSGDKKTVTLATLFGNLGWYYFLNKSYKESLEASQRSVDAYYNSPYVHFNMGLVYLFLGDPSKASERYKTALELVKSKPNKSQLIEDLGLKDLRDARKSVPNDLQKNIDEMIAALEKEK
jgi:tetratricopeptide (TPR) repeat protein